MYMYRLSVFNLMIQYCHAYILDEADTIATLHVVVEDNQNIDDVVYNVKAYLKKKHGVVHATVEVEKKGSVCIDVKIDAIQTKHAH